MKAVSLLLKRWLFLSFLYLKLALTPANNRIQIYITPGDKEYVDLDTFIENLETVSYMTPTQPKVLKPNTFLLAKVVKLIIWILVL